MRGNFSLTCSSLRSNSSKLPDQMCSYKTLFTNPVTHMDIPKAFKKDHKSRITKVQLYFSINIIIPWHADLHNPYINKRQHSILQYSSQIILLTIMAIATVLFYCTYSNKQFNERITKKQLLATMCSFTLHVYLYRIIIIILTHVCNHVLIECLFKFKNTLQQIAT